MYDHDSDPGPWDRGEGESPSRPPSLRRISLNDLSPPMRPSGSSPRGLPRASDSPAGSTSPDPDCPTCNGSGWLVAGVPYGHPAFGQLKRCTCLEQAAYQARQAALAARIGELTAQLGEELGRLSNCTFDQFSLRRTLAPITWRGETYDEDAQRRMLARSLSLARAYVCGPEGLYLYGPNGSGKSHLAAAILNAAAAAGTPARYGSAPALLRLVRQGMRDGSADDRLEALARVPLLAIDDLGAEQPSDWADVALFDLLKARDNRGLGTVITSNLPPAELRDPRIASLVQGNSLIVPLITSDYRALLAEQRIA